MICYDRPDDDTLPAVQRQSRRASGPAGRVRDAIRRAARTPPIMAGFAASTAPLVVVYPADDDFNPGILDTDGRAGAAGLRRGLRQPLHAEGGTMQGCRC